jgi:hypothetical protein
MLHSPESPRIMRIIMIVDMHRHLWSVFERYPNAGHRLTRRFGGPPLQESELDANKRTADILGEMEGAGISRTVIVVADVALRLGEGLFSTFQAITNAIVRAEKWLQKATPDDVADAVPPENLMGDRKLYISAFNKMRESLSPDGRTTAKSAQTVYNVLTAFMSEIKAAKVDLAGIYDTHFVGLTSRTPWKALHPSRLRLRSHFGPRAPLLSGEEGEGLLLRFGQILRRHLVAGDPGRGAADRQADQPALRAGSVQRSPARA